MRFLRLLIVVFLFSACGGAPTNSVAPGANAPASARAIRDDLGRLVVLPENVTRAVSLAPNLTEIIFAVGAGERLVGVTSYCDFPSGTASIAKVGDTLKPNIEAIIALRPEVVFVSTASQLEVFTRTLNDQKIAVFVTNPDSLEGILASIEKIGAVFRSPDAGKLLEDLRRRIDAVESKTTGATRPKVFVQLDRSLFTIGRDSYLTDLIRRAGGTSATADLEKAYAQLSKESALALAPDVIILSDSSDNKEPADVLSKSPAVTNGRVYRINADVMSRPGPRVVDALEQIAAALHTERFSK